MTLSCIDRSASARAIADAALRVDNNPTTRAIAEQAESQHLDSRDILRVIRSILDDLITEFRGC